MQMHFEQDVFSDFDSATEYEWLERNKHGAYAASTLIGVNLRREHGLFVVPPRNQAEKFVILSKFEESVFVENHLYEISTNLYSDAIFPRGYQYIVSAEINPFPRLLFRIDDRKVRKTLFLHKERNLLLVRYELLNQGRPIKLIIKPFLAARSHHSINTDTQGINTDSYLGRGWVRWMPRPFQPEIYVYFQKGEFVPATLWYHNFYYPKDAGRYTDQRESLFNPGFFQVELKPYETLDLFVSTEVLSPEELDYEALYRQEVSARKIKQNGFLAEIKMQSERVRLTKVNDLPVWPITDLEPQHSMRDLLFTLPLLFTLDDRLGEFQQIYNEIASHVKEGLLPTQYPFDKQSKPFYGAADLSLWFIVLGYFYFLQSGNLEPFEQRLFDIYREIISYYSKGTLFNIYSDKDHLIFCGNKKTNLSWIPLVKPNGEVLRYGKLVEINALWYNALKITEFFSRRLGKNRLANKYLKQAEKVQKSFNQKFVNRQENSFNDFLTLENENHDFRINQLIPLCLPFALVPRETALPIFKRVQEELVTPYGIRSQSSYDPGYREDEQVVNYRNVAQYYSGAIWPWAIFFYTHAYINLSTNQKFVVNDFWNYFRPMLELTQSGLLGFVPEAVFLNDHVRQDGIQDYATSMAGILWSDYLLRHAEQS